MIRKDTDQFFAGADAQLATGKSEFRYSVSDTVRGFRNAIGIAIDLIRYRETGKASNPYQFLHVRGRCLHSDEVISVIYAGTGTNHDWCLSSVFRKYETIDTQQSTSVDNIVQLIEATLSEANLVFTEGFPLPELKGKPVASLALPAWARQRLRVHRDWRTQVAQLKRGTRQEIARILRKHQYTCIPTHEQVDLDYFYDSLYQPYVLQRHGESGILVGRERFMRECRRGVVLQLNDGEKVVAAVVLRQIANTMAILWSGNAIDGKSPGATDILDYFSLMYASAKHCSWLDYGRSRPSFHDGVLRYKRKWGAEFTPGFVRPSEIQLACVENGPVEKAFLQRQAYVLRNRREFRAVLFINGDMTSTELTARIKHILTPGIVEYRIIAFAPVSDALHNAVSGSAYPLRLIETSSVQAALFAAAE